MSGVMIHYLRYQMFQAQNVLSVTNTMHESMTLKCVHLIFPVLMTLMSTLRTQLNIASSVMILDMQLRTILKLDLSFKNTIFQKTSAIFFFYIILCTINGVSSGNGIKKAFVSRS